MTEQKSEEQQVVEVQLPEKGAARHIGRNIFQERFFFFLLLALLAFLSLLLIWPNLNAILAALAIVVIIKPLYDWFLKKRWVAGKANRATMLTILTFIFAIAIPVILFVWMALNQADALLTDPTTGEHLTTQSIANGFREFVDELSATSEGGLDRAQIVEELKAIGRAITDWLATLLAQIAGLVSNFLVGAVIVLVIMMVLLPRFETPDREQLATLIPFPPDIRVR